jgi:hypothetical protein
MNLLRRPVDASYVRRREGQQQNSVSVLIATALSVALFAGAALANPAAFDRTIDRATGALFGHERVERARSRGGDQGRRSPQTHAPEECLVLVDAFERAAPPSDDPRGIAHAIDVVQANCEQNPKAVGLLRALSRLRANAEKHADHESNAGGRGGGGERGSAEHGKRRGDAEKGRSHGRDHGSSHNGGSTHEVRSSHGR